MHHQARQEAIITATRCLGWTLGSTWLAVFVFGLGIAIPRLEWVAVVLGVMIFCLVPGALFVIVTGELIGRVSCVFAGEAVVASRIALALSLIVYFTCVGWILAGMLNPQFWP